MGEARTDKSSLEYANVIYNFNETFEFQSILSALFISNKSFSPLKHLLSHRKKAIKY